MDFSFGDKVVIKDFTARIMRGDRVGIIDAGEIRAEGTQRELVALIGERDTVRLNVTGDVTGAAADVPLVPGVVRAAAAWVAAWAEGWAGAE